MDWNLRTEILEITHRWPVIVLYILAGCLIGGLVAYLLPAPFQAERSLLVTYNADIYPRNPDDYKNWQMEQLNVFILSDEILQETLTRLQEQNPVWESTSLADLRSRLHVYWRNTGEWRLVADAPSAAQAQQLVQAWEQASLDKFSDAREASLSILELSTRLDAISNQLVDNKMRSAGLAEIGQALETWKAAHSGSQANPPLETPERWNLLAQVSRAVEWDPAGIALLEDTPTANASASEYLSWVDQASVITRQGQSLLEAQSGQLRTEYDQLYANWSMQQDASAGLTAFILVEPTNLEEGGVQQTRSSGLMAFIGGMLGLLVWGLVYLGRPFYRSKVRTA